jgi:NADH-quinone oxidoreductase subunit L
MMLGLGIAGFSPHVLVEGFTSGIFYLVSHGLFKASLFLCAGAVIHTAHSIYMHEMGALKKYMPFTWVFMGIAALSLMGVPPLPGFWSKEMVMVACLEAQHYALLIGALVTVILTSFYTVRFLGMVFHGQPSEHMDKLRKKGAHLGEGHWTMTLACAILTLAILALGFMGPKMGSFLFAEFAVKLGQKLHLPMKAVAPSGAPLFLPVLSVLCVLLGAVPAYILYVHGKTNPATLLKNPLLKGLHKFFWERWYIDRFYYWFFVGGIERLSRLVPKLAEDPLDNLLHRRLPLLVTQKANRALHTLRTESRSNAIRVGYVLILFVFFILALLWGPR